MKKKTLENWGKLLREHKLSNNIDVSTEKRLIRFIVN